MGGGLGLLLVAIFLSLVAPSVSSSYGGSRALERRREFDFFVLALQWPGSFCKRTHHCCPSNGCCRSSAALDEFTIHGLWPDYNDGSWPACCTTSHFDKKKVSPLLEKLNKYWPSLSCSSSSLCHGGKGLFWAHEWEKHGTCSSPVINDEFSYFLTTLDLYFKYNMTEILNRAGISANNSEKYQLSDILAAVKNSTGASPLLVCSHDDIQELRLCFSKEFKPRDCTTASRLLYDSRNSRASCPKYVSLPRHKPLVRREGNVMPELAQVGAEMELVARD